MIATSTAANARRLAERGRFDAALQCLGWELVLQPDDPDVLLTRARLLEWRGEVDEALATCERVLERLGRVGQGGAPPDLRAGAWLTKGSLHARRGERMSALECFRRARKLLPASAGVERLIASVGGRGFDAPLRGEVAELFEQYADRFDQFLLDELGYRGHLVLTETIGGLAAPRPGWRVLDLGCGTGLCGPGLRPLAEWLGGVDLSSRSVARARQRGVYHLAWVADLVYALLTWPGDDLDVLVSADVLGYLGELSPVLVEARRVLRPGGRLAFTVEVLEGPGEYALGASRRFAYGRAYLRRVLPENGLAVEVFREESLRREAGRAVPAFVVVGRVRPAEDKEGS